MNTHIRQNISEHTASCGKGSRKSAKGRRKICGEKIEITTMSADAQRDGHPGKYRWCPLFNDAKFSWRPLLECRAVTLPIRETRLKYLGCPKQPNRSQPLLGRRFILWEHVEEILLLNIFFRLSIHALVVKI